MFTRNNKKRGGNLKRFVLVVFSVFIILLCSGLFPINAQASSDSTHYLRTNKENYCLGETVEINFSSGDLYLIYEGNKMSYRGISPARFSPSETGTYTLELITSNKTRLVADFYVSQSINITENKIMDDNITVTDNTTYINNTNVNITDSENITEYFLGEEIIFQLQKKL